MTNQLVEVDGLTIDPPDPTKEETHWCNTAGCFAGWRAFRDGYRFHVTQDYLGGARSASELQNAAGEKILVEEYAMLRLELEYGEDEYLFTSGNTLDDLKDRVEELCDDVERSEESKALLRETLQDVIEADKVGRWHQGEWVRTIAEIELLREDGDDE